MSQRDFYQNYEVPCLTLNLASFCVLISAELYVLIKIRFRLDLSAAITLSLYTICISMRTSQWIIFAFEGYNELDTPQQAYTVFALSCVNSAAERLKWFIMYYFTLEMQAVKIKVESTSIANYKQMMRSHMVQKWFHYGLCFILSISVLALNIYRHYNSIQSSESKLQLPEPSRTIAIALRTLKCLQDIYIFVIFFRVFIFFTHTKQAKLRERKQGLSRQQKLICAMTLGLAVLNLYHALSSLAFYMYNYFNNMDNDNDPDTNASSTGDSIAHNIHRFIIYSIIDMLTAVGVLYLFYELEMRLSRQKDDSKVGNNPKMVENRPNHGTEQIRDILKHSGDSSDEEDDQSENQEGGKKDRLLAGEFTDSQIEEGSQSSFSKPLLEHHGRGAGAGQRRLLGEAEKKVYSKINTIDSMESGSSGGNSMLFSSNLGILSRSYVSGKEVIEQKVQILHEESSDAPEDDSSKRSHLRGKDQSMLSEDESLGSTHKHKKSMKKASKALKKKQYIDDNDESSIAFKDQSRFHAFLLSNLRSN